MNCQRRIWFLSVNAIIQRHGYFGYAKDVMLMKQTMTDLEAQYFYMSFLLFEILWNGQVSNVELCFCVRLAITLHFLNQAVNNMLNSLRIKLEEARSHSSESTLKQPRHHKVETKVAESVRQKIDNTLKKTYQKLRLDGRSNMKCNPSPYQSLKDSIPGQSKEQTKPHTNNPKHISLRRSTNYSANGHYFTPIVKSQQTKMQKDEIVLVDNRDVMAYIQLIYQTYNIKDPLSMEDNLEMMGSSSTIEKNKKDGLMLDQWESLNSARTIKEEATNAIQVSEFDDGQYSSIKKVTNKKSNKIVITLRCKSAQKNYSHLNKQAKANPLLPFKEQEHESMTDRGIKQSKQLKRHNKDENIDIVPTFRYCFACQKSIFQPNILKHESQCKELKLAYTFSFDKILSILDGKIQRIIGKIDKDVIGMSAHQFSSRFQHLQGLIKAWTGSAYINDSSSTGKHQFRNEYQTIMRNLDTNFYDNFELLNKLNWFTRLRHNIMARKALF